MNEDPRDIIQSPIISEKNTYLLQEENKYVFRVPLKVNKIQIRNAVEDLFKVKVEKVSTIKVRGKKRKWRGRTVGKTSTYKKAIVKLREGETIKELEI